MEMSLGMKMMLKQIGLDPEKLMSDFSTLTDGVKKTLGEINTRLQRLEQQQQQILNLLQEGVAWQRKQEWKPQLAAPQPPQPAQNQPQPPPVEQSIPQPSQQ